MATPPFNLDISDPTDGVLGNTYPANARQFRDNVNSYLNTDHDIVTGHHAFPLLTTTQIAALTTPPTGMVVWDTTLSLLKFNIGTPGAPVWQAIGPGIAGFHAQLYPATGGAQVFTIPTTSVKFTVVGGGGGGGGGGFAATYGGGGGGGGGGIVIAYYVGLTIGNTLNVSPGGHGLAGTGAASGSATAGTAGANSSVTSGTQTITSAIAAGGQPGQPGSSAGGGTGGLGGTANSGPPGALSFAGGTGYIGGFAGVANGQVPGGMFGLQVSVGSINGSGGLGGSASSSGASNGFVGFDGFVLAEWLA